MKSRRTQKGFTIIELSIATLVFSVLLAIIMSAFLGVGRMFVKGTNMSLTQQDARNITDSISNDIRFSDASPIIPGGQTGNNLYFCVGAHRYKFMRAHQVQSSSEVMQIGNPPNQGYPNYGLVREDVGGGCPPPDTVDGTHPTEMLSNGMQLNDLHFGDAIGGECNGKLCKITINLLFYGGDNSVFASPSGQTPAWQATDAHCTGSDVGTQFCATTSYTTTVLQSSQQDD